MQTSEDIRICEVIIHRKGMPHLLKCLIIAEDLAGAVKSINADKAYKNSFFTVDDVIYHCWYVKEKSKTELINTDANGSKG